MPNWFFICFEREKKEANTTLWNVFFPRNFWCFERALNANAKSQILLEEQKRNVQKKKRHKKQNDIPY